MFKIWEWYDKINDLWKLLVGFVLVTFVWVAIINDNWIRITILVAVFILLIFRWSYCFCKAVNKICKKTEKI